MRNQGFTLLEVVLAIGLAGAVLGLLTTALDLYLVRVDTSRTQVETAQLARTLLNQIGNDLRAVRYFSPSSSSDEESSNEESGNGANADPSLVQGIFGTAAELRIDRSATWQWEYHARLAEATSTSGATNTTPSQDVMPQTVRYLLGEGKELLAGKLAASGVGTEPLAAGYGGLYREQISTVAWLAEQSTSGSTLASGNTDNAELIAPEVVDIIFAYFDGEQLLNEWDSGLEQRLPNAIEIRLTLLEEPFEQAATRTSSNRDELRNSRENLVEYRLVVNLSNLQQPHEAEFPQPISPGEQPPGP